MLITMKFQGFIMLLILVSLSSCKGQESNTVETIPAEAFAKKLSETPSPQIIDVRTPEEFNSEHIDNAKNINWFEADFASKAEKLDPTKPVYVYCKSGGRSAKAAAKFAELGFKNIYNLEGGFLKWSSKGFTKSDNKIIGMTNQAYNDLLNSNKKVLISFYAKWCAPCKKMEAFMLKMQKDLADKVVIVRLDADENKTLIKDMKIDELPTLLLYEKKAIKWKHSGFISEEELKKQL